MGAVREPPHSREAEQAVLGSVLVWPDHAGDVFTKVSSRDFYVPQHQAIADGIQLVMSQPAFDVVLVSSVLRSRDELDRVGGLRYLVQLTSVPTGPSVLPYYTDLVRELSRRRTIIASCSRIIDAAYDEARPLGEITKQYQELDLGGPGHSRRGVPV